MSGGTPGTRQTVGRVLVPLAAAAAVIGPAVGPALGLRASVAEVFLSRGDPLVPPGWAFAIWGPLYAGCVAAGAWVGLGRGKACGAAWWPMAGALVCVGGWPAAAQAGVVWATVVVILGAVACAWMATQRLAAAQRSVEAARLDGWLLLYPMAGLAGWLTVASGVNVHAWARQLGVANAAGWVQGVTAGVVLLGVAVAVAAMWRGLRGGPGVRSFSLPVVWGLGAVAVGRMGAGEPAGGWSGLAVLAGGLAAATAAGAAAVRWWGGLGVALAGDGAGDEHPQSTARGLVLFDGGCGLCHASVRVLLRLDRRGGLVFAPLEGVTSRSMLDEAERAGLPDSLIYVPLSGGRRTGEVQLRSGAVAAALRAGGGAGGVAGAALGALPRGMCDRVYDVVARVRRRVMAAPKGACPLVPGRVRRRMLP